MKRFHIALAIADLHDSIADYSNRLGQAPAVIVAGQYAITGRLSRTPEIETAG